MSTSISKTQITEILSQKLSWANTEVFHLHWANSRDSTSHIFMYCKSSHIIQFIKNASTSHASKGSEWAGAALRGEEKAQSVWGWVLAMYIQIPGGRRRLRRWIKAPYIGVQWKDNARSSLWSPGLSVRVSRHGLRACGVSSLEILSRYLERVLPNWPQVSLLEPWLGTGALQRPFPASAILWLCWLKDLWNGQISRLNLWPQILDKTVALLIVLKSAKECTCCMTWIS